MLKANPDPDKVNYTHLVKNQKRVKVFARLDTDKMRKQIEGFREELLAVLLHSVRIMCIGEQWVEA